MLKNLKEHHKGKDERKIKSTLRLIEIVIDDSEKGNETEIECLLNKKKTQLVRFIVINELSYVSDSIKKTHIDCPIGLSLMSLKRKLAKEFNVAWKEIKVVANR